MIEEVVWSNGTCVTTTSGASVYTDTNFNTLATQEQCNGYAVTDGNQAIVLTEVGSGTMEITNQGLDTNDYSYRFAGGDYKIADAYQSTYSKIYDEIILLTCDGESQSIRDYCRSENFYYTLAYDTNNTQYTTMKSALEKAVEDGYLVKDNIKNYVCFGTNVTPCPEENLYRILGVFDGEVKLIKADYATADELGTNGEYTGIDFDNSHSYKGNLDLSLIGTYNWNVVNYDLAYQETGYRNVWSYSELNTVNLNTNYLNALAEEWQEKIAITEWKVGGFGDDNISFSELFDYEINNPNNNTGETTYNAKIGLMYISDYVYASPVEDWNVTVNDYAYAEESDPNDNWLYMGLTEWPITPHFDGVSRIENEGTVTSLMPNRGYGAIRPTFYLNSDVTYVGGSGTSSDPIRIN